MPSVDPSCPRCGYDMTGVVESWREGCPLAGRCSECGLDFAWSDLLNPTLTVPAWSFEHTAHHRLRNWVRTARRSLRPKVFWRAIHIYHPIRRTRLVIFALLCVMITHAVCALAVAALVAWATVSRGAPLAWLLQPNVPTPATQADVNSYVARLAAVAAVAPYGRWNMAIDVASLARNPAWFLVVASAIMPLPFLILADTFSLARIRFIHLLRVWAYSQPAIWLLAVLLIGIELFTSSTVWGRRSRALVTSAVGVFGLVWLVVWWWRACTLYLRVPEARAVLIAMTIIALLASIAWMAYVQPQIADGFDWMADWLRDLI